MSPESTTLTLHPQFRQQVLLFLDKYKPRGMIHPSAIGGGCGAQVPASAQSVDVRSSREQVSTRASIT
ncbi:hypothetical protein BMJ32_26565 [Sinorhizobium medicae]|nr:hypothetical protein BMJ35_06580 [Sinorhizobium medicae]PLT96648.1 hypothetical protein BMJ32_26565 [Sinorhizobium medicae]PLU20864.1 hypothetical protein BMJ31_17705 [Sinorhizobium medicae]PLU25816.1 hypothetical protein BMJ28_33105 [Sinorhizobium medicae]PLU33342.1 hypothetical protein BMJ26_24330 [Sinorhizobium medicae]